LNQQISVPGVLVQISVMEESSHDAQLIDTTQLQQKPPVAP